MFLFTYNSPSPPPLAICVNHKTHTLMSQRVMTGGKSQTHTQQEFCSGPEMKARCPQSFPGTPRQQKESRSHLVWSLQLLSLKWNGGLLSRSYHLISYPFIHFFMKSRNFNSSNLNYIMDATIHLWEFGGIIYTLQQRMKILSLWKNHICKELQTDWTKFPKEQPRSIFTIWQ